VLDNDKHDILKLFLVEEKLGGIMLTFGDIRISYLFDKYSPASGGFVP